MPSMMMAYIAFGGGGQRITEFEESQRSDRERREEYIEERKKDSKKTSKQKRQVANKLLNIKKIFIK